MSRGLCLNILVIVSFILASCATVPLFNSPEDFRHINGTLFLSNGDSLKGIIDMTAHHAAPVTIHVEHQKRPLQFGKEEVKGYKILGEHFELKGVKRNEFSGTVYHFMKRLTPENSRLHLYEQVEKTGVTGRGGYSHYKTHYYLRLPHENKETPSPLNSSRFIPHFENKMSSLVSDCASLAQKIKNKEEGYTYSESNLFKDDRAKNLLNIIEEYNQCE